MITSLLDRIISLTENRNKNNLLIDVDWLNFISFLMPNPISKACFCRVNLFTLIVLPYWKPVFNHRLWFKFLSDFAFHMSGWYFWSSISILALPRLWWSLSLHLLPLLLLSTATASIFYHRPAVIYKKQFLRSQLFHGRSFPSLYNYIYLVILVTDSDIHIDYYHYHYHHHHNHHNHNHYQLSSSTKIKAKFQW